MGDIDPLHRANILVRVGRVREAVESLRISIDAEPNRDDLKARLAEVQKDNPKLDLVVLFHLCMSWVFLWGPALVLALLMRWGATIVDAVFGVNGPSIAVMFLGLLLVATLVCTAYYASLHLWFVYLKYVVGHRLAAVECRLSGFIWTDRMEPIYSRVRAQYLPSRSET